MLRFSKFLAASAKFSSLIDWPQLILGRALCSGASVLGKFLPAGFAVRRNASQKIRS